MATVIGISATARTCYALARRRQVPVTRRIRRHARRVVKWADEWGRRLGVLPYRPERRTTQEWSAAYGAGALDYYAQLDELARYSVIIGYVGWVASEVLARPPSVLDVGCGSGVLRRRLEEAPFSDYVGIDLSDAAIEVARRQAFSRSRFVVGDVTTTELGQFDVVVLNEVLYYAGDALAFLERVRKLLREGGIVFVSMWRHPGDRLLWKTVDTAFRVIDRVEVRNRANPMNAQGWIVACCEPRT